MIIPGDEHAAVFHAGAARASQALSVWLGRPASVVVNRLTAVSLAEATTLLGDDDSPVAVCAMQVSGGVSGVLLLACDDAAGLTLADLVLERDPGTAAGWGDLERSAVVETANIVGCGYLNAIAAGLGQGGSAGILPSPPWFVRDFPAAVMEAAVLGQVPAADAVVLAATEFRIAGMPVKCGLVFVPDAAGLGVVVSGSGG